jgi:hypothetical protein
MAQTVTECQNLYKNSFLYHTASATPDAPKQVPLDECVAFIGACTAPDATPRAQRAAGTRSAAARRRRFALWAGLTRCPLRGRRGVDRGARAGAGALHERLLTVRPGSRSTAALALPCQHASMHRDETLTWHASRPAPAAPPRA